MMPRQVGIDGAAEPALKRVMSQNSFFEAVRKRCLMAAGRKKPPAAAGGDGQEPGSSSSGGGRGPRQTRGGAARDESANRTRPQEPPSAPPSSSSSSLLGGLLNSLMWLPSPPPDDDDDSDLPDPDITFASCGGLEDQIAYIQKHVMMILENAAEFERWGIDPVKGIIFYGPPGSGKTLLAKALANELKSTDGRPFKFLMRNGSEFVGKYMGETEERIRKLFDDAKRQAPAIIFLDELDGLAGSRETNSTNQRFYSMVVNQLLGCMDDVVRGDVLVIGATNRLEALDPAFRRPGRFDKSLAFHLPNAAARVVILKIHSRKWRNGPSDADLETVAASTVGFTGADLEHLCREALVKGFERQFPTYSPGQRLDLSGLRIQIRDWQKALENTTRTNTNVFGLAHFSGSLAPEEIRRLTVALESDLSAKILPWLDTITRQDQGTEVNALLVWSNHRRTVATLNSHVIPSLVSTFDPALVTAYRMDVRDIASPAAIYQFMAKVLDTNKTKLLIIPHLDYIMATVGDYNSLWMPFLTELQRLRGSKVLLLATAAADRHDLRCEDLRSLLSTAESLQVRNVSTAEAKAYLEELFTPEYYQSMQAPFAVGTSSGGGCTPAALAKLTKGLPPLLAKATDMAHRHQISDALDLKALLKRSISVKLSPSQHLLAIKNTLNACRTSFTNSMYN